MSDEHIEDSVAAHGVAISGLSVVRLTVQWVIAAASLVVIGGFIYWTVTLGTRDPHEVPIILAMEGPSRVAPEDPGGATASHQGLAVNTVQAQGAVESPAREVVLAPDPAQPTEDDLPLGQAQAASVKAAETPQAPPEKPTRVTPTMASIVDPLEEEKSEADLDALEIADSVAQAVAQRSLAETDPALIPAANIRGTKQSPKTSKRPKGRPDTLRAQVVNVERTAAVASASVETDTVPIGTRLIQLGAYDKAELARSQWDSLMERHSDLLEGKKRLVIEAQSGGRKFYRLRAAGFNSLDESRSMCSALLARGTPCIPVTAR